MIKDIIQASIDVKQQILNDAKLVQTTQDIVEAITTALQNGHRVLFCGNGGSAADAQHLAAELSGRFYFDRPPLNSEALHCNTSYLTAVANDYGYDMIYARMINGSCAKGDVLIGLSTSGNSQNIVQAFEAAKQLGVIIIAFTGSTGGKMKEYSDFLLNVPSNDTPRIQEAHVMLGHIICEKVEAAIFGKQK